MESSGRAVLVAVVLLAITSTLHAQSVAAPTFRIAPPSIGPASGAREELLTAASNDQFLAVWRDSRANGPRMWGTRVSTDGAPLDRAGFPLTTPVSPSQYIGDIRPLAVGSDGTDFVVITSNGRSSVDPAALLARSAVVRADGTHAENLEVLPKLNAASLVWLGDRYVLVYASSPADAYGVGYVQLDRSGLQISSPRMLVTTGSYVRSVAAAATSSALQIVWADGKDGRAHTIQFPVAEIGRGAADAIAVQYDGSTADPAAANVSIATDGTQFVCTWNDQAFHSVAPSTLRARLLSSDGTANGSDIDLGTTVVEGHPSVVTTGGAFVVAYASQVSNSDGKLVTVELRDGVAQQPVTYGMSVDPRYTTISANSAAAVAFWMTPSIPTAEVSAAPLPIASTSADAGSVISLGACTEDTMQMVWSGSNYVAVWRSCSNLLFRRFDGSGKPLDASGVSFAPATAGTQFALATDGQKALVLWSDGLAMRTTVLDAAGHFRTLAEVFPTGQLVGFRPLLAWDGREYIGLWAANASPQPTTVGVHFGADGDALGEPVSIPVWLADVQLLIPLDGGFSALIDMRLGFCFPICTPSSTLYLTVLAPDLSVAAPAQVISRSSEQYPDYSGSPAYARRGSEALIAFASNNSIRGIRVLGAGTIVDPPAGVAIGDGAHVTGVLPSGSGYTVVAGPAAWDVAFDPLTIRPTTAFAFAPPDTSSRVLLPRNPLAFVVAGGPRALLVYQEPADTQNDVPSFVGAFSLGYRTRAVLH